MSHKTATEYSAEACVNGLPDRIYVRLAYTDGWWLKAMTETQLDEPGRPCGEYELKRIVTPKIVRTVVFE